MKGPFEFTDKGTGPLSPSRAQHHEVKPIIQKLQNVHIPTLALTTPHPNPCSTSTGKAGVDDDDDALQDWNERASALFEWVGMINIGAQRYFVPDDIVRRGDLYEIEVFPDCKPTTEWIHTLPFTLHRTHPPLGTCYTSNGTAC
jgi:hypothetical protein